MAEEASLHHLLKGADKALIAADQHKNKMVVHEG